jgi:ribosomal-protein-alanine N-acetyltransferase
MSTGRAIWRERDRSVADANAIHIRWMIRRDMPDVMGIELSSFEFAWTEDDFLRCLRQRNCIGMVAERGDSILGFMIYELHRTRLNVLNFAVAPLARRGGIGRMMVGKLVYKLCSHRRQKITLAVREGNTAAQLFFHAHRFKAAKVLRGYYEDSGEDAYQMEYKPAESEWAEFGGPPVNRIAMYRT